MKKCYTCRQVALLCLLWILPFLSIHQTFSQTPAFPGAHGFGKYAVGGRYGSVYHVTNLNNAGAGSLRDAVSAPNRIVVFDVGGVIKITSRIVVASDIYIAGQTAPGEGITVYGNGWSFSGANNAIFRYLRIRMGIVGDDGKDAAGIADGHDMIFDHCSFSWGRDETFSINSTTAKNITLQNCIFSQGLLTHSAGGLMQADSITLYRNLYVDNGTRNNKIKGVNQYVNNIVYNWKDGAYIMGGESEGHSYANAVNSCFIKGPSNAVPPFNLGNLNYHIYASGNIFDSSRNGVFDPYVIPSSEYVGPPDFQPVPYSFPAIPTLPANQLVDSLLPHAGASLPYRDYADYYVLNEIKSFGKKGEFIANENSLPFGVPTTWLLWTGNPRIDSDNDGMPDEWETMNGTNPSADDAMVLTASGYTNIENYINSITANNSQPYLRAPMKLKQDSATSNTLYLSWLDYTEKEQGYKLERRVNGVWTQTGTTGVNENYFSITHLQPEAADTFRVKAFNGSGESAWSNELITKTKPVEVPVLDPGSFKPLLSWTGAINQDWDKATSNWADSNNIAVTFTDSSTLSFPESGVTGTNVNITASMPAGDIVVNSTGSYTFSGPGYIAGTKSFNKTGSGTVSLLTNNTYTGATVLHSGTIELNSLANGGTPSSIGASANYAFNWVWKGGEWLYSGGTTATDRNIALDATTRFNVSNSAGTVTFNGVLSGDGGLVKSGPGKLVLKNANPYIGETIINGGTLEVSPVSSATLAGNIIDNNQAIGTSNVLRLHNGTYRTTNGSNTIYENYPLQLYIEDGTVNGFEPDPVCNLSMTVHGSGTLHYTIPYLREIIQGDWSDFSGTLVANGTNPTDGYSLLAIDNGSGFPNNRLVITGNTKIAAFSNNNVFSIGGLSGNAGTWLSCGGTKTASFGNGVTTYVVGGAGTNETFNGVINNHLYGATTDVNGTTTIVKTGAGIWRLNGNNTYAGTTTVQEGKLIVNGINAGSGPVTVDEGAILAGKGTIASEVVIAGTLEPGDSSVSTLVLKDKLTLQSSAITTIDINKSNNTSDTLAVTKDIAYGGTFRINFTGIPASGDKFKLFNVQGAISGTITQFEPAVPAPGLLWVFKPATGELAVQSPNFVEAPSNLILNAPAAAAGMPATVSCTWTDNSDNEDYFILERSADNVTFTDIAHPAANITSYVDGGLQSGDTYYYRVKAHSPLNVSTYSPVVSITTPQEGTVPAVVTNPSPIHNATNVLLSNQSVSFNWEGNYADNYLVYIGTDTNNLVKAGDVAAGTPVFTLANLLPNTQYYWRVDAENSNGTTIGSVWHFKTANVPLNIAGDYRSVTTGNWGTSTVATDVWQVFNGDSWNDTTAAPSSATATVTIRTGHTVRLNATATVNNLVLEEGATLVSGTSDGASGTAAIRTLRVVNSLNNFGTVGSGSTSTNRVNFEAYLASGTTLISGTGSYYLNTFVVNNIAQTVEVLIDANLNLSGYMRANYSTATTLPWTGNAQNDDSITITINEGKTVTIGSSGYLQAGSSPTTNTIGEFGNYTFNINGTLDMRSTGTSCVVGHATLPGNTTININGKWLMGNAIRFITAATTPAAGSVVLNIGSPGVVDAGARTINSGNAATNIVATNKNFTQVVFFNMADGGVLKTKVGNSDVTYQIGADNVFSPVKLNNSGVADIIGVSVRKGINLPVPDSTKLVKVQYNIIPATPATNKLAVSLGWVEESQGANLDPAGSIVQGRYTNNSWTEYPAIITGAGTTASPYFATVANHMDFGSFVVAQTGAVRDTIAPVARAKAVEVLLGLDGTVSVSAGQVDDNSSDNSGKFTLSVFPSSFTTANVGVDSVILTVTDASGNIAHAKTTVTVKKRPAGLVYMGDSSKQYSDQQLLNAVLTDLVTGTPLSGKEVRFNLGNQSTGAPTDSSGKANASLLITQEPGLAYMLKAHVAEDSLFLAAADSIPYAILPEDALAYYTGTVLANTGFGSSAKITLSAAVSENAAGDTDLFAGDIRNAKVSFINRATNSVVATVPVKLMNANDTKRGVATYDWFVNIGNSNVKTFTVGILVSGYYNRNTVEDDTLITVSKGKHGYSNLQVSLAPNPTSGSTRLTINSNPEKGMVYIKVFNLLGRIVEAKQCAPGPATIQLGSQYKPGIYIIEVSQGFLKKTVTLIKTF